MFKCLLFQWTFKIEHHWGNTIVPTCAGVRSSQMPYTFKWLSKETFSSRQQYQLSWQSLTKASFTFTGLLLIEFRMDTFHSTGLVNSTSKWTGLLPPWKLDKPVDWPPYIRVTQVSNSSLMWPLTFNHHLLFTAWKSFYIWISIISYILVCVCVLFIVYCFSI